MAAVDFSAHAVNPFAAGSAAAQASAQAATGDEGFSFGDLLDIVNPLQHIPVVSTLYRAITGDTIKTGPKIAGDTLYGGIMGFASSMADTVFAKITGKDVGDTVLGWMEDLTGIHIDGKGAPATGYAGNTLQAPADVKPASLSDLDIHLPQLALPDVSLSPAVGALMNSLTARGTDPELARRAAAAYQRSLDTAGAAVSSALH